MAFFDNFIKQFPKDDQTALKQLRKNILAAAPQAEEGVSSKVPAFKYKGKYLASMNATKSHISLFMMRGEVLKKMQGDLGNFDSTNVAVRFSTDRPLPADLVKEIISARIREIDQAESTGP